MNREYDPGSFRDPSGYVFQEDGELFRVINKCYRADYDALMNSGLFSELSDRGLIVSHEEVVPPNGLEREEYKLIKPTKVPFISYPYEWCFSMLKDAALLSLDVMDCALRFGMILKDASSYNVQFINGKPVFIDTLSFERYTEGVPWVAYGQFCRHFLAPLALVAYSDARLTQLLTLNIDGIPLDLAAVVLPSRAKLDIGLLMHLFLHASAVTKAGKSGVGRRGGFSSIAMRALVDNLRSTVSRLTWKLPETRWSSYGEDDKYSEAARKAKREIVERYLQNCRGRFVIDIGSNDGRYSFIARDLGMTVVACDSDSVAIERLYRRQKDNGGGILPLIVDFMNPSPAIGWENSERAGFFDRIKGEATILALALIHHLAIAGNIPIARIIAALTAQASDIILEFVPKTDPQVQEMLSNRKDIIFDYSIEALVKFGADKMELNETSGIANSGRTMLRFSVI